MIDPFVPQKKELSYFFSCSWMALPSLLCKDRHQHASDSVIILSSFEPRIWKIHSLEGFFVMKNIHTCFEDGDSFLFFFRVLLLLVFMRLAGDLLQGSNSVVGWEIDP
jgi:hypothetical protein